MAYMHTYPDGSTDGPFPNKRGEFCRNYNPRYAPLRIDIETQEEADVRELEWLSLMRFGRPGRVASDTLTLKEMAELKLVGLYFREDQPLLSFHTPVETDELTEEVVTAE